MVELADTDLAAARSADQADAEPILLTPSVAAAHTTTVVRPVASGQLVPFNLRWNPDRAHTAAVARSHAALTADLPPAGAPSPVTCTTASESYARRARTNPAITAPSRLRQRQR